MPQSESERAGESARRPAAGPAGAQAPASGATGSAATGSGAPQGAGPSAPTTAGTGAKAPASSGKPADRTVPSAKEQTEKRNRDQTLETKNEAKETRADWMLFRAAVALVGLLLAGFGIYFVLAGTAGLPEPTSEINATLESQYRFFAALMAGVGAAFLTIAIKFEWANVLWFVCAMVFIGGIARVISWALSGTPHVVMIVLMVLELSVPPVLVVWHRWVTKTQELKRSYSRTGTPRQK